MAAPLRGSGRRRHRGEQWVRPGTTLELARSGSAVVVAARSAEALADLAREYPAAGGRAHAVPTDVSDPDAVAALAQAEVSAFGRIDVWINNAGVAAVGRFDEVPLADHDQVVRTDLLGTVYGSHHALRRFRAGGRGVLVNVASVIGKIPAPLYASYAAAKFGVVGLGDALRQELRDEPGVRVCTVMPMAHDTEFFEHAGNYTGKKTVPLPPTYDPQVTIDALVKLVVEAEDAVITGWQGSVFNFFHKLMPGAIERFMAKITEKAQLRDAPPAQRTAGNIHDPADA